MTSLYTPLDPAKREIRLVTALRCPKQREHHPENIIKCSLEAHSLDSGIEYEALSYVWGSPKGLRWIQVNGQKTQIHRNLSGALRQFSNFGWYQGKYLWVDALCINQADFEERKQQVRLMGDIYRSAGFVRVWLGHYNGNAAAMEKLLQSLPRAFSPKSQGPLYQIYNEAHLREILGNIAHRPYWVRSWIMQEVYLAQHISVHLGAGSCEFWRLAYALYMLGLDRHMTRIIGPSIALRMLRIIRFIHASKLSQKSTALLTQVNPGLATDPKDLVYSLLALLPPDIGIEPDYTATVETVFARATIAVLQYDRSLAFLSTAGLINGRPNSLPTWAVNLRSRVSSFARGSILLRDIRLRTPDELFLAEAGVEDPTELIIRACIIGEVDSRGSWYMARHKLVHAHNGVRTALQKWRDWSNARRAEKGNYIAPEKLWRTLAMGWPIETDWRAPRALRFTERPDIDAETIQDLTDWLDGQDLHYEDSEAFLRRSLIGRCFFTLDGCSPVPNGAIGAIHAREARHGDVVAVPCVSPAPLLLRPVSETSTEKRFQLVGMCYVDDLPDSDPVEQLALARGVEIGELFMPVILV